MFSKEDGMSEYVRKHDVEPSRVPFQWRKRDEVTSTLPFQQRKHLSVVPFLFFLPLPLRHRLTIGCILFC